MPEEIDDWVGDGASSPPAAPETTPEPTAAPDPLPTEASPEAAEAPTDPDAPLVAEEDEEPEGESARERDVKGRYRTRAKAKEAVNRINELTRRLRIAEGQISQRASKPAGPVYDLPPAPAAPGSAPEPTIEQFAEHDDPYGAHQRALARYDVEQRDLTRQMQQYESQGRQREAQARQGWDTVRLTHQKRMMDAVAKNPNAAALLQSVVVEPPPLLDLSIMLDDHSADVALFLAEHPVILDELSLLAAARPVNEGTVATMQRLLRQKMTAGSSGSVAPSHLPRAPHPPNPLRTAPMTTGDSVGSNDSLDAHERQFHRRPGRR